MKYCVIFIKLTRYKADIFLRWKIATCGDGFTVKLLPKSLYKKDIYKADSQKMDTLFMYFKILPKTTLCKANTGLKNVFHEKSTHIFLLKLLLNTI